MGTSTRNLSLALIAALSVHFLVLTQILVFQTPLAVNQKPIAVNLQAIDEEQEVEQPIQEPEPEPEPIEKVQEPLEPEPSQPTITSEDVIVASKPSIDSEPEVVVQASLQSNTFKRFLKSETDRYTSQNSDSVGEFDQTFKAPDPYGSPEELSPYNGNPVLKGNGVFAVEQKGKRTCYVEDFNLLDISASSAYVPKDCTPKKKFDLKLNQLNNGWSER